MTPAAWPATSGGLQGPLWRAIVVFRFASLAFALALIAVNVHDYRRPLAAIPVVVVLIGWTVLASWLFARPERRRWPLLIADLVVTGAVLLSAGWVVGPDALGHGTPGLAVAWLAGPVLAWAVAGGRRLGVVAALLLGLADLSVRPQLNQASLTGTSLMLLAAVGVGHVTRLAAIAQERLQAAVELEAANRERERLARDIHDSVLQVLALVRRRGATLDGEAGELARLAGEQEAALRRLIATGSPPPSLSGDVDVGALVAAYASDVVSVAAPASPVLLPAEVAAQVAAAVGAALDNAARHAGPDARVFVLLEDEPDGVTVTVRDDGAGIPADRLAAAEREGRLGVAQAIRGRITDLGGVVRIHSAPGQGTEIEMAVPRLGDDRNAHA
jgi:signal transduction histidine kinase